MSANLPRYRGMHPGCIAGLPFDETREDHRVIPERLRCPGRRFKGSLVAADHNVLETLKKWISRLRRLAAAAFQTLPNSRGNPLHQFVPVKNFESLFEGRFIWRSRPGRKITPKSSPTTSESTRLMLWLARQVSPVVLPLLRTGAFEPHSSPGCWPRKPAATSGLLFFRERNGMRGKGHERRSSS